jgi:hypothetical protein
MIIDDALVICAITAMATAITALWWHFERKITKLEIKFEAAIKDRCVQGATTPRWCHKHMHKLLPQTDVHTKCALEKTAIILFVVLLLSGCSVNRQEKQVSHKVGVESGQPVDVVTTTQTTEASSSGVDVGAVVSAAIQASQGKILGALESLKPQSLPSESGTNWGTIAGGGIAALMALLAAMQAKRASEIKKEKEAVTKDCDNTYERLIEANRQLPPK